MVRLSISLVFILPIFVTLYVKSCFACNGYKMNLISAENCGSENVVSIDGNFTAILSSECILSSVGCIHSKGFKQAKVKYSISKNGHELLSGNPDICNVLDHKSLEQKARLEMFGFPTECPIPEGDKCMDGSKKVDVSKYKSLLPMAVGKITAKYDVTHDTGKTCAVVKFEIVEKK